MKNVLRWVPAALAAAVVLGCQVERLLRGSGSGNGPPADTVAARVAFSTQPKNAMVGQTITPPVAVVVTDSSGNPVPSYSGSVTIALGANAMGATLSGGNTATAASGVAAFPGLSVDKAGSGYTLTATSIGLSGATSTPFDVSARPAPLATHVAFIAQPSTTRAGDPFSPAIQVAAEDSTGAVVSTYTGAITVAIGANPVAGTLSGTRVVAATSGTASFSSLRIDRAGTGYTLTASASGLAGATSTTFEVTALPPPPPMATSLHFTAQPQSAQTGGSLGTITVAAVDSTGTVVTAFNGTAALAIGTNPGGGTLSGTASLAFGNGVATFTGLSINKAGNGYTLTASTSGLKGATSSTFNVTAPPPTTGSVTVTATTTGSDLDPDGYRVSVDGGGAQSVSDNGSVTFNNLAAGSHTVAMTGLASNCSASSTSQSVTVSAGGSTSASFAITCVAPPPTNHPPVVNAGKKQSVVEGVLYQLNASFTDIDGDGPWTYNVNWGDGTSSSGTLSAQGAIGPTHTYLRPNDYMITVTVTDAHGASGADSTTLHVTL